jgi:uncharacterized tellurite resistance protein B-like protein
VEKEIAASVAPLIAEMLRPKGFSPASERLVRNFFQKHFPALQLEPVLQSVESYVVRGAQPMLKITCRHLRELIDENSCRLIITFLLELAAADDFVHARKLRMAQRMASYLHLAEEDFNIVRQKFLSHHSPYSILQVDASASLAEVKKAYRKMVLMYHPDKRPNDVSEQEAREKFLQIQAAFEAIVNGYEME